MEFTEPTALTRQACVPSFSPCLSSIHQLKSVIIYHYLPKSAIICHYLPKSTIICQKVPECVKCPLPVWYICTVTCQRRSPFGSRSMFDRFPLVLRYSFVRPSFVLRSVSVREARCNGDVTDKEKTRNKPGYQSQRSLKWFVTRSNTENITGRFYRLMTRCIMFFAPGVRMRRLEM